jgi:hypothetical protein
VTPRDGDDPGDDPGGDGLSDDGLIDDGLSDRCADGTLDDVGSEDEDDDAGSEDEDDDDAFADDVDEESKEDDDQEPDAMGDDDVTQEEAELVSVEKLSQKWFEVTCLLRHGFSDHGSYHAGVSAVAEAEAALARIEAVSDARGVNTGQAFQALLSSLSSGPGGGIGRAASHYDAYGSEVGRLGMGEAEWQALAAGADRLRSLVRIKLEDANDLQAAKMALELASTFFASIQLHAKAREIDAYEMAEQLS